MSKWRGWAKQVMYRVWHKGLLFVLLWVGVTAVFAQESAGRLFITGSEVGSPPGVDLQVYGYDAAGNRLNLANETMLVQHEGVAATDVQVTGSSEVGTFTLFLLDIPQGIEAQFPTIQQTISEFTQAPTMKEQVDAVAIYKVGAETAVVLMPPDQFYNSVRNFFNNPLQAEAGATALVDSLVGLINQVNDLKPDPAMAASIVVISDGTDVVSSRFQPEDVPGQAQNQGVAVHTIWLDNENLSEANRQIGRDYMAEVAAASWGLSTNLNNAEDIATLWNRIASFREQTTVSYVASNMTGGAANVTLSLANTPATQATTTIDVPTTSPSVVLNVPPDGRVLTLPDVNKPIKLRFSATVSWLDGEERQVEAAQLQVNGGVVPNLEIEDLSDFEAEISNLVFGSNVVQIALIDDQGIRVTSPPLFLTINEGAEEVPEALQSGGGIGRIIGILVILFIVVALLVGVFFLAQRNGFKLPLRAPRGRRQRRSPTPPITPSAPTPDQTIYNPPDGQSQVEWGYLEILESVTEMPPEIGLSLDEVRIGRSPNLVNIPFEQDITVSRHHITLMLEGNRYRLYDAGSTSGTWVNEQQVPEYGIQLRDGDEIFLGQVHLRFRQL
jgi:hypothetical protein